MCVVRILRCTMKPGSRFHISFFFFFNNLKFIPAIYFIIATLWFLSLCTDVPVTRVPFHENRFYCVVCVFVFFFSLLFVLLNIKPHTLSRMIGTSLLVLCCIMHICIPKRPSSGSQPVVNHWTQRVSNWCIPMTHDRQCGQDTHNRIINNLCWM